MKAEACLKQLRSAMLCFCGQLSANARSFQHVAGDRTLLRVLLGRYDEAAGAQAKLCWEIREELLKEIEKAAPLDWNCKPTLEELARSKRESELRGQIEALQRELDQITKPEVDAP